MLKIGLTGGIGSGKSTVSNRFAALGVPVLDADEYSHRLSRPGTSTFDAIVAKFGTEILTESGQLDRAKLRQLVFDDHDKRQVLESILHPAIRHQMDHDANNQDAPYCIFSIPLLLETQQKDRFDRILVIDASDAKRREWIKQRSQLTDTEIEAIFNSQVNRDTRINAADDVLVNEGSIKELEAKVDKLHSRYLKLAENSQA